MIEYEPLGAVTRAELAVADGAPLLHEEAGTNVLIAREFKKGDVAADLQGRGVRVGDRFEMTRKAPLAMEPRSYSAEYRKQARCDYALHLVEHSRHRSRRDVGIARSSRHRLRVVAPDVGGSFGSKGHSIPKKF